MLKKIEAETKAEVTKYIYCSEVAAVEMDDGISDVATVAVGIQSVCGAELQTLARISATPQATWVSSLHPHVVATILARRVKLQKAKKKT